MAIDPISAGTVALSGFKAFQQYEAGKEAQAAYNEQAAEIERRMAGRQLFGLEQQKELGREGRSATSRVRAGAGGKGVTAGGSVSTQEGKIKAEVARRQSLIGTRFEEEARQGRFRIDQFRSAGRDVAKAAGLQAFASLLTGGARLARRKQRLGTTTGGLFFKNLRDRPAHDDLFKGRSFLT